MTRRTRLLVLWVALWLVLMVSGCADPNFAENNFELCDRDLSGFFQGLWHGFIAPVTFLISLFDAEVAIYDICNIGAWYDFGFCLGIGAFSSGSHSAARVSTGGSGDERASSEEAADAEDREDRGASSP